MHSFHLVRGRLRLAVRLVVPGIFVAIVLGVPSTGTAVVNLGGPPSALPNVEARDAILAADLGRFGGANQDLIWQAFAMRGFGQFQSTVNNADTDPVPDFSSPMANNATLNFYADSKDGSAVPVNAKIYVGDYEARSTPIADTDASTGPGSNLDNTAQFVPSGAARWRPAIVGSPTTSPLWRPASGSSASR